MSPELDAGRLIRSIVLALHSRPGEWLSFGVAARITNIDPDLLAGLAEARPDIFIINDDRRLKLQTVIVEQIVRTGIAQWQVPIMPSREVIPSWRSRPELAREVPGAVCYCDLPEKYILNDLVRGSIPEEALVNRCCWKQVCRVRGLNSNSVDPEVWREICQQRGYLQARGNPRGF